MPEESKEDKKELILIFGKTGWIGGQLGEICEKEGIAYKFAESRLQNREDVTRELDTIKPTHVINAAGVTGRPNVDWCEDHKQETVRANVIGTLTLVDVCELKGIHVTNMATGCIFSYDDEHVMGGKPFTEDDNANFFGSWYSLTKGFVEQMLRPYKNCCTLRVRMPISDDLSPRNFITKISKYEKIVNIPNSMTILHDLLPVAIKIAQRKLTGVYNFTNPGAISHNQVMDLYAKYIDPENTYVNFTEEEQNKILKAQRSNNELDSSKLLAEFPDIPDVITGMEGVFQRMKANLAKDSAGPPAKKPKK